MENRKKKINIKVEEFTTPCSIFATLKTPAKDLEEWMQKESIRHILVLDDSRNVVGIVSQRDVLNSYRFQQKEDVLAQDIMKVDPYIVDENTDIGEVAFYMSETKIGSAIVQNADGDIGIFTSTDALNALIEIIRGEL